MKAILQSVSDTCVAFNDQVYWVAPHVLKYGLSKFHAGMEVDVTVKPDENGTPVVTFLKQAGMPPSPKSGSGYNQAPQQQKYTQYQQQVATPPKTQTIPTDNNGFYALAGAIAVAYNLDPTAIASTAKMIKEIITKPPAPIAPPIQQAPPVMPQMAPPVQYAPPVQQVPQMAPQMQYAPPTQQQYQVPPGEYQPEDI